MRPISLGNVDDECFTVGFPDRVNIFSLACCSQAVSCAVTQQWPLRSGMPLIALRSIRDGAWQSPLRKIASHTIMKMNPVYGDTDRSDPGDRAFYGRFVIGLASADFDSDEAVLMDRHVGCLVLIYIADNTKKRPQYSAMADGDRRSLQ